MLSARRRIVERVHLFSKVAFTPGKHFSEEKKLRYVIWNDVWTYYKRKALAFNVIACGGMIVGAVWLWKFAGKKEPIFPAFGSTENIILNSFEVGRGLETFAEKDSRATVSRPNLHADLKAILYPTETEHYAVIVGENGTGKSTAVRQVLASSEGPKGVYFNCPPNHKRFSIELSRLICHEAEVDIRGAIRRRIEGINKEEKIPVYLDEPMSTFSTFESNLLNAAKKFKAKHGCPMVLVIDSADVIAKNDASFLGFLQDFAKNCADMGTLRIVFISSDGSALPLLMSRSAWSRAEKPPFEIGEISNDDAVSYLEQRGVPRQVAEQAVQTISGGLFASLNDFTSNYRKGKKLEDIVIELDSKTSIVLLDLKIKVDHPVFRQILVGGSIRSDEARKLGMSSEEVQRLVSNNILATHPNATLSFHDRHVDVWFKKKQLY